MKRNELLALAAAGTVAIGALIGCAGARLTTPPPSVAARTIVGAPAQDLVLLAKGQEVFEQTCAKCHTVDGAPIAPGPDLSDYGSEGWSRPRVIDMITDFQRYYPGSNMPTWDESYPREDIEAVAAYVMSLKKEAYYLPPQD